MPKDAESHLEEMRQKYHEERDKRIREEGNEQYIEVAGDFAHVVDDPGLGDAGDRCFNTVRADF